MPRQLKKSSRLIILNNLFRGLIIIVLAISFLVAPTPAKAIIATTTLDPNSPGDSTQLAVVYPFPPFTAPNWQVCADTINVTLVSSTGTDWQNDLYNLPDVSLTGTIKSVTVHIQARVLYNPRQPSARTSIRTGGSDYFGGPVTLTTSWAPYSTTYTTNPNTSASWTWDQINSLQAGVSLKRSRPLLSDPSWTTKVWVTVDYCIPPSVYAGGDQQTCQNGDSIALTGETPPGGTWNGPGVSGSQFVPDSLPPGAYSVMYTYTDPDGCANSDNKTVTINPLPDCNISCNPGSCSACFGGNVNLMENGGDALSWLWSTGETTQSIVVNASDNYSVDITDQNGCHSTCRKEVTINPLLDCTITAPLAVCDNSTGNIASVPYAGAGATYNWTITNGTITGGSVTNSITWDAGATSPITIGINIIGSGGCSCSNPGINITVNPRPTATASSNSPVCLGGNIQLTGGPDNMTSYRWTGPNGITSNQQSPLIPNATAFMSGDYFITVINANGCTSNTAKVTVSVVPCGGGGGIGAGLIDAGQITAGISCPLALALNMEGSTTVASMSGTGVLCEACIARDAAGKYVLELDKETQVILAGNTVPLLLRFRESSNRPPAPENTAIIGPVYEISAYPTSYATVPSPVTISPPAVLTLPYDPKGLPENATEVYIADYDATKGWLAMASVPGAVAELGKAQGLASHFSPFAVLAKLAESQPAKFEVSNLTASPYQVQPNQEVAIGIKVTNAGGKIGDYSLQLKVDGMLKSSKQVTIPAGTSQTFNFTITEGAVGRHQVEIAGQTGQFTVTEPPSKMNWWPVEGIIAALILGVGIWMMMRLRSV